jgi:hypothetical protein
MSPPKACVENIASSNNGSQAGGSASQTNSTGGTTIGTSPGGPVAQVSQSGQSTSDAQRKSNYKKASEMQVKDEDSGK